MNSSTFKKIIIFVCDRFFLLRPLVMVPALTFFLLGYVAAGGGSQQGMGRVGLAFISYAVLMGSIYVINQIADIESDRANDKLFLLPRGIVSKTEAGLLAFLMTVFSMAGAWRVGGWTLWLFVLSLLIGVLYSVPPFALKRLFPFDVLSNAVGYGLVAYSAGWSVVGRPGLSDVARALPFAFCVAGVFVLTALDDKEGDTRSGYRSTGVVLSQRQGVRLALFLIAAGLASAIPAGNWIAAAGSAAALPFFIYASLKEEPRSVKIAYRSGSAVFVLIAGAVRPLFLVGVLILLGLSRVYYSKRFSLDYPSIRGR